MRRMNDIQLNPDTSSSTSFLSSCMRVTHSEHLDQSLDRASDVFQRSNMLRKLTCTAGC